VIEERRIGGSLASDVARNRVNEYGSSSPSSIPSAPRGSAVRRGSRKARDLRVRDRESDLVVSFEMLRPQIAYLGPELLPFVVGAFRIAIHHHAEGMQPSRIAIRPSKRGKRVPTVVERKPFSSLALACDQDGGC